MRAINIALSIMCIALTAAAPQSVWAQDEAGGAVERHYCTQFGPFFLRFDPDKAAGVFSILPNDDLGAMVGVLEDRTLTGSWIENDSKGAIRLVFSEDWSSFEAGYTVAPDQENWREGWTGYLPPAGDPPSFDIADETFLCR